jgi:hypothetical protein
MFIKILKWIYYKYIHEVDDYEIEIWEADEVDYMSTDDYEEGVLNKCRKNGHVCPGIGKDPQFKCKIPVWKHIGLQAAELLYYSADTAINYLYNNLPKGGE